jgi:hypothetical protein
MQAISPPKYHANYSVRVITCSVLWGEKYGNSFILVYLANMSVQRERFDDWWIMNWNGCERKPLISSRHFLTRDVDNYEEPQSEQAVSRPILKPRISRIRLWISNYLTTTFGELCFKQHTIIWGTEDSGLLLILNLFNGSFNCAACAGLQSGSGICEQWIGRDLEASNCGINKHSSEAPMQIPEPQSGEQPAASFEPWSNRIRMTFGRITVVSTHEESASERMNRMDQVHYTALVEWGRSGRGSKWSCHILL